MRFEARPWARVTSGSILFVSLGPHGPKKELIAVVLQSLYANSTTDKRRRAKKR